MRQAKGNALERKRGTVAFKVTRRESNPFTVDIFQQSAGSKVVKERLVARFTNRTGDFVWNG